DVIRTRGEASPQPSARSYNELGHLRSGEEAKRDERGSEAGRDVEHRRVVAIDTLHISRREVREAEPPARIRNHDLPSVEVPREDEVKDTRNPADDPGEVAEQDAQIGAGVDEVFRMRASVGVRSGIDADDLNAPSSELELDALVAQE